MLRIEDGRHSKLQSQRVLTEEQRHVGRLVVSDSMFARKRAADRNHALHQAFADRFNFFQFTRFL